MELVEKSYHAASRGVAWICEASYKFARYAVPGRTMELKMSVGTPVFLLGVKYSADTEEDCEPVFERILSDARSRIWLTYRSGFECIENTPFSSDAGWGCMMRSGQMILAQALLVLTLGRDWRSNISLPSAEQEQQSSESLVDTNSSSCENGSQEADETWLVALFADCVGAPFSIHKIVLEGALLGHQAGSWMGPASISQVISVLVNRTLGSQKNGHVAIANEVAGAEVEGYHGTDASGEGEVTLGKDEPNSSPLRVPCLSVHVAMDGIIYLKNVRELAQQDCNRWVPVMILVPLRLGLDQLNIEYVPTLQAMFELPQSLGIIGGRPRRSHYFVGCKGNELLYLDPHEVQPALSQRQPTVSTCHYPTAIPTTALAEIDPSLALGFLCKTQDELDDLRRQCECVFARGLPLFSISSDGPPDWRPDMDQDCEDEFGED